MLVGLAKPLVQGESIELTLTFAKAGKHTLTVSLVDGDRAKASLSAVSIRPVE